LVQCFLFQDGGVAALGANIFDMGVIGSLGSFFLYHLISRIKRNPRSIFWAGFWAAWITVFVSSLNCAFMLVLSRVVSWKIGFSVIGGVHAILGLLEGVVTGTILQAISRSRPDLFDRPKI
jgi:cobalt/nickel transport system permease protein